MYLRHPRNCSRPFLALLSHAALALWIVAFALPVRAQIGVPYVADEPPPGEAASDATADTASTGAALADPPPIIAQAVAAGHPPSFFYALWAERRNALERGDLAAADRKLEEIRAAKKRSRWPDLDVFAQALAVESREQSDTDRAAMLATAAAELAPHALSALYALMAAKWANTELLGAAQAVGRSVLLTFSEPPLFRIRAGNTLLTLMIGILIAAVGFALIAMFRYARLMVHDVRHLMPSGVRSWQAAVVGAAAFVAPILFRLGMLWCVIIWLLLVGLYLQKAERITAVLVTVALAAFAFALPLMARHLSYAGSRSQSVYLAVRSIGATHVAEGIARGKNHLPEELYALGLRALWSGQLRVSRQLLERAIKAGGTMPELHTHLGNVRFALGDREGALRAYQDAIVREPDHVVAHFNMSRVHYSRAEHQKAGIAHRRASGIDFERVERYAREAKQAGRAYVAPEKVPRAMLNLSYSSEPVHRLGVRQAWLWLGAGTPRVTYGIVAMLAAVLLGLMGFLRRPLGLAVECSRCGIAACRRCNPEMPDQKQCGQCFHAFVIEDEAVDPQLRIRKEIEAHRHEAAQKRLSRLISLLLAGGGQLLSGAPFKGVAFLVVFATCLVGLLGSIGVLPSPTTVPDARLPGISALVSGFSAVIVYALALWDGSRES